MGLEYRGSRVSEDQDIIRLLDARAKAEQVTDPSDAQAIIDSRVSGLASKGYVDSAFEPYATQADVNAAYANKANYSDIGDTIFGLDGDGKIGVDQLPELSSRGARWVPGGSVTERLNIGDGGLFATTTQLSSVYVNGSSLMGGRPYSMMGFAQIEVKGNYDASRPAVGISRHLFATDYIAIGYGIPGWKSYYHLNVLPATNSKQIYTGNVTMYLTCRSTGASSDFMAFYPEWGILLIPVLESP